MSWPILRIWAMTKKNIYIIIRKKNKLDKVVDLVGGGPVINGAYPV